MDIKTIKEELAKTRKKLAALEVLAGEEAEEEESTGDVEKSASSKVVAALDQIAGLLEGQNDPELTKYAYEIDQISDLLEGKKQAAAIVSESDEHYMKDHFKAGIREGDKLQGGFETDMDEELRKKQEKGDLNAKKASSLPYQKLKN